MFDSLMVFLKEFFEKVDFEKNQTITKKHERLPSSYIFLIISFFKLRLKSILLVIEK